MFWNLLEETQQVYHLSVVITFKRWKNIQVIRMLKHCDNTKQWTFKRKGCLSK